PLFRAVCTAARWHAFQGEAGERVMAKMRVKWNLKAWTALRHAPGDMADLDAQASRIAHAAGPGFTRRQARKGTAGPRPRARASVGTTDDKSRRKQADENVLQRALNAGRG